MYSTQQWWHLDQNGTIPNNTGKQCVQGLVSLYDATVATGGLCVIPGSHHRFAEICNRSSFRNGDYVAVGQEDPILQPTSPNNPVGKLVCCKAGDLIVWDSRLIHCNTPAPLDYVAENLKEHPHTEEEDRELIRLVGYVCMVPRAFSTNEQVLDRQLCYETNTQTSHWPHRHIRPRRHPHGSTHTKVLNYAAAPNERKDLIGKVQDTGGASSVSVSTRCVVS